MNRFIIEHLGLLRVVVVICDIGPTLYVTPLRSEYLARQKCILSFGGDCIQIYDIEVSLTAW